MAGRRRQFSYQKKTVLLFSILIGILILIFLVIYFNSQRNSIEQKEKETMKQLSVKAVNQLEEMLNNMHRISYGTAADKDVLAVMRRAEEYTGDENYFEKYPQERKIIQMVLMKLVGENFRNRSFHVITDKNDWLNLDIYDDAYINKEGIAALPWRTKMEEEQKIKYITPLMKDGYLRTNSQIFSYVRQIQDEYQKLGYIDIQYEKKMLDDIFKLQLNKEPIQVGVYYQDELFFYTDLKNSKNTILEFDKNIQYTENGLMQELKVQDKQYLVYGVDIPTYEMQICLYVDEKSYMGAIYESLIWIIILGIILIFVMIILVMLVTENLYRPIRQLRDSIQHMNYGELAINREIEDTDDEIQMLTSTFNEMLDKMKRSRNELVEAKTRAVRAKYEVLQAQINPHFMHNILSVIGLMGYQKGASEIMDICSDLTKMLQYTTDMGKSTVTIQEEAEHVSTYLKLMGYRYLERLQVEIYIPEEIQRVRVPKFILQPITENCFQHSFANMRKKNYKIHVIGSGNDENWKIQILDNGDGFTEEALEKLIGQFQEIDVNLQEGNSIQEMGIGGMALVNTYARLAIYSEGQIHMKVGNRPEGGSWVSFVREKGEKQDVESADCRG